MKDRIKLRVVFMGTPSFVVPVLCALVENGYDVVGVVTKPDRPAGRGMKILVPEVKRTALELGLTIVQPTSLRNNQETLRQLTSLAPDLIISAAYGSYLPTDILNLPPTGCLNIHPSLLPQYRGASPVAAAILNGDGYTGVTVMKIDEGIDTGPIIAQEKISIGPTDTTDELTVHLFRIGTRLLLEVIPTWIRGEICPQLQDDSRATIASRVTKENGIIDWRLSGIQIARQVRAYTSWPGSFTAWKNKSIKIIEAALVESDLTTLQSPGLIRLIPEGVGVVTGEGILKIQTLQLEGRRPTGALEFIRGQRDFIGSVVGV